MGVTLSVAAIGMEAFGTMQQAAAQRAAGKAAQQEADYEATQLRQQRDAAMATASRQVQNEQHQKDLIESRATAVGAASGQDLTSPTLMNIMGSLEQEGQYRADTALYEGQSKAQDLNSQADLTTWEGQQKKKAANRAANATIVSGLGKAISGGSSLYSKYGTSATSGGKYGFGQTSLSNGDTIDWTSGRAF